jgi:hypothetical protein
MQTDDRCHYLIVGLFVMMAIEIIDPRHVTPVIFAFSKTCFCTISSTDINEVSKKGKCVLSIGPSEAPSDDNRVNGMFSPSDRSMQDSIEAPEGPIDFCPCSRRQRDGHAIVRAVSVEKSQNVRCHRHIFQ